MIKSKIKFTWINGSNQVQVSSLLPWSDLFPFNQIFQSFLLSHSPFVPSSLLSFFPSFLLSFFPSFLLSFFPSFLLSFSPSFLLSFFPFPFLELVSSWKFRYPLKQKSPPQFLHGCQFYFLKVLMKEGFGKDQVSLGIQHPNGTYERPMSGKNLFWVLPGKSLL